jgi:ABC-type spermidine/putrescine transport system permease subunit II
VTFSRDPGTAIRLSVLVGIWAVVLGLPVALVVGWMLARLDFRGKTALTTLVMAPLVLPPEGTGLLLLRLSDRRARSGPRWPRWVSTSALDRPAPTRVAAAMRKLRHRRGFSVLLVTRDPADLRELAESSLTLIDGRLVLANFDAATG